MGLVSSVFIATSLDGFIINDITITLIPVILGGGKSLFGKLERDISLKHIATKSYDFGFVQLTYEVEKNA